MAAPIFKFNLGIQAKDKITGLTGQITGRIEYITGCNQYILQPQVINNVFQEPRWVDEDRIVLITNLP